MRLSNKKSFLIINGRKNKTRGNHAHKKCSQLFVPLLGKFILNIKTPYKQKKIVLSHVLLTFVSRKSNISDVLRRRWPNNA